MNHLQLEKKQDYVIVQLNRGKVNAINHEMVDEIRNTFQSLENDESVKGVILTGQPNYFSAGLDVIELFKYDEKQIREFFIAFGSMHIELAKFSKPLICAITGHSPAGGCVMAIAADYRVMGDNPKYTIGLNEMAVNIQISSNLISAYSFWLGQSKANQFILEGKLLNPQEALTYGLVDEVCELEKVLPQAEKKMEQYLLAEPRIFKNTKERIRGDWWANINNNAEAELEEAIAVWWSPNVRMRMEAFVYYLSNRSKSKKS